MCRVSVKEDSKVLDDSALVKAQRFLLAVMLFLLVLAICPFTPDPSGDIKTLVYEVFAFILLGLWLFTPRSWRVLRPSSAMFPLFLIFLLLNLSASFTSVNVGYSLTRQLIGMASLFILLLVAADVHRTPKQFWNLVIVLCAGVSVASVYGFVQHMGLDPFPWKDATGMLRTAPSTFGNPNFASHTLAPAIILAAGLCMQKGRRWALLFLPVFIGHLALTQTRGSLLALAGAFSLIVVAYLVSRWVKNPVRATAVTFGALLLIGAAGVIAMGATYKAKTGYPYPDDGSLTFRYHSFYGACRMIHDRPWLGFGPGMYQVANPPYWTDFEKDRLSVIKRTSFQVHNEPLEMAVNAGLAAGLVYVFILLLGIYYGLFMAFGSDGRERKTLGIAMAAFFFAFLVDGFFGFNTQVPVSAALLYIVSGAAISAWRNRRAEPAPDAPAGSASMSRCPAAVAVVVLILAAAIPVYAVREFAAQFANQRGCGALDYKAYDAAANCFAAAATLSPYNWVHPYYLGVTALQKSQPERAVDYLSRSLELNPNYLSAELKFAEASFNIAAKSGGKDTAALTAATEHAQRAAQLDPFLPDVHDLLGRVLYLQSQSLSAANAPDTAVAEICEQAERHLLKAVECGSKNKYKLYQLIAMARLQYGNTTGAQKALVQSIDDKPDEMETWRLLSEVCRKNGSFDTVLTSLDHYVELAQAADPAVKSAKPGSPGTPRDDHTDAAALAVYKGKVLYSDVRDVDAAGKAFELAVEKWPGRLDAWAAYHDFAATAGREEEFKARLLKRIGQEKDAQKLPAPIRAAAAGLQGGMDGLVAGVSVLVDEVQRIEPSEQAKSAPSYSWAADVLAAQAERAGLPADKAGDLFFKLGLVYGVFEDFKKAAALLQLATPHLSDEQLLLCLLKKGAALDKAGEISAAAKAFEEAVDNAPTSLEARYAFAKALEKDGQKNRARDEYLTILGNFQLNEEGRSNIQRELAALPK